MISEENLITMLQFFLKDNDLGKFLPQKMNTLESFLITKLRLSVSEAFKTALNGVCYLDDDKKFDTNAEYFAINENGKLVSIQNTEWRHIYILQIIYKNFHDEKPLYKWAVIHDPDHAEDYLKWVYPSRV